jgi:tetratricopeptide (TPR) repeat protein
MRKEFVVVLLALCAATAPALAQNAVRSLGNYQHGVVANTGTSDQPQENDYANGRRLLHFEKYAEAIPFLRRAHIEQPHNADILAYLGYAYHKTDDNDLALDYYHEALQENPDHLLAHEYMGELYLGLNYLPQAQEQLARLNQLCPSGCDERDALTKAIASYQPPASAAPPPKSSN